MNNQELPPYFDNNFESIYANFGARFGALLLDGLILAPITIVFMLWNASDLYSFYYSAPITLIVTFVYTVYLPLKFGATPGKRLIGMRILKSNGDAIDFKDSFMRYLPNFLLALIAISCNLVAVHYADPEIYNNAQWIEKTNYLTKLNPRMYYSQMTISYIYFFANLILFLSNPRRRSISDFSGDTVVIYDRFLDKVKAFNNSNSSEKEII